MSFGQRASFIASLALFALAQLLLFVLAVQGTVPNALAALVLLYPVQLRWSLQAMAEGLTPPAIARLQGRYRALHALMGVAMAAALWLE